MTKASTGTRRVSTARVRAKVAKRVLPSGPEPSNAGTRPEEEKRTGRDGSESADIDDWELNVLKAYP